MLYALPGIVMKQLDYGESHKIITIFTAELGKVSLMVRGAKKIKSRHTAATQLFTSGIFSFHKQPGKMGTLHQGEVTHSFQLLRQDLTKTAFAAYIAEMIERLIQDEEASTYLYAQFEAALQAIESNKDSEIVSHVFEMKMLEFQGYTPHLSSCVACRDEGEEYVFSSVLGGLLCMTCRLRDPRAVPLSTAVVKLLRLFVALDLRRLGEITIKPETKQQLHRVMRAYMDYHVDLTWKSRNFIDQMGKFL